MNPYYSDDLVTIYHGDCREILPETRADVVITDPPYTFGLASTAGKLGWADLMNAAGFYANILGQVRTITPEDGAAWVFNSWRTFPVLARAAWDAQWDVQSLMVWDKGPEVGMGGSRGLRAQYEMIALFAGPAFSIANRSAKDIVNVPWGGSSPRTFHAAQKPTGIIDHLLSISTTKPIIVLDPFMGSGTTIVSAKNAGHRAIGIEAEERYCEIAAERCRQEVLAI